MHKRRRLYTCRGTSSNEWRQVLHVSRGLLLVVMPVNSLVVDLTFEQSENITNACF